MRAPALGERGRNNTRRRTLLLTAREFQERQVPRRGSVARARARARVYVPDLQFIIIQQ